MESFLNPCEGLKDMEVISRVKTCYSGTVQHIMALDGAACLWPLDLHAIELQSLRFEKSQIDVVLVPMSLQVQEIIRI